ncbi:MAG: dihydrolipoyl dehydrogenase [Gemmataceae bacterium]
MRYDLIVIGGGPGGYVAAIRAAQLGKTVAVVEKRATLGGTCLNVGCIPSKALLDSSEVYAQARHGFARHGVQVDGVKLDLAAMMARKESVVKTLTQGLAGLMRKNKITVHSGAGRLVGPPQGGVHRVHVQGAKEETLETAAVLLATGSEPIALPSLPFDGTSIVSSTEALAFDKVPAHLIVVGGGYIGLELGSVWLRLGAKVTVVEFLPRILPVTDGELAGLMHKSLAKQGMTFHLETRVTAAGVRGGEVVVSANSKGRDLEFIGDKVLVSVGRRPYTAGLGLAEAGVKLEEKTGRVPVTDRFETNVPGIYAIGDLIHGPMLAHKAEEDGVAFAEQQAGMKTHVHYDLVPSVIYTWPEVASVGPTEEQLKESGRAYKVGRFPFTASPRARCMDESEGLVKVIADATTDRLLAVHIMGPRASDLIAEAVAVMEFGGSAEDIARTCHAHPTLGEAVKEAALGVDKRTIHL